MTREKRLSISDITQELNMGKATLKFLLKRFKEYLPCDHAEGQPFYHAGIINTLGTIREDLEMGMLPSEIENRLQNSPVSVSAIESNSFPPDNIPLTKDGFNAFKTLFAEIGHQQERIAAAHEKRAMAEEKRAIAEERKAAAIEKRAAAEENKAHAMNHIAQALQEMNRIRLQDSESGMIAHQAASAILTDETHEELPPVIPDSPERQDAPDEIDIDLTSLLDEESLIEEISVLDAFSETTDPVEDIELDDLSRLLDEVSTDLPAMETLDDLSLLIEPDMPAPAQELPMQHLDDLSKLLDTPEPHIEDTRKMPPIRIEISPEEDLEAYKAAIMKVILELKTDGLSAEETTARLNQSKVRTLSGKPEWHHKSISQIYEFMSAAK